QIDRAAGVLVSRPVGYADVPGFQGQSGGTVQTTGSGMALGMPTDYASTFPREIRFLVGAKSGVLIAQQTAANLHAGPGSVIRIGRPGMRAARVRVDGVIDLPQADSLFQTVGAPPGSGPTAPPDNVVLLPIAH